MKLKTYQVDLMKWFFRVYVRTMKYGSKVFKIDHSRGRNKNLFVIISCIEISSCLNEHYVAFFFISNASIIFDGSINSIHVSIRAREWVEKKRTNISQGTRWIAITTHTIFYLLTCCGKSNWPLIKWILKRVVSMCNVLNMSNSFSFQIVA